MSRESLADISARYGQYSTFGHKDYEMAKKAGYSDNDIKSWLDEDTSRLHKNNRKGGSDGLYDEIASKTVDLRKKVDIDRGPSKSTLDRSKAQPKPQPKLQPKPQPKPQPQPRPQPKPQPPEPIRGIGGVTKDEFDKGARQAPQRMAGSQEFQKSLDSVKNNQGASFEEQVGREQNYQIQQESFNDKRSTDIYNKYLFANRDAQKGRGDGSSIANKYIFNASKTNPIDVVALDKHIRRGPMYHESKSELAGLLTYGDKYRNSRENIKGWTQPSPTPDVERPDFSDMYDRFKNDLDDIKI
jgi:hypothetical protein